MVKFAVINDMHVGPLGSGISNGVQRKLVSKSAHLLNKFVERMNTDEHPEFVVNLGDSIEDVNNREIDIQSFKKSIALLSRLNMPIYSLVGNHDVRTLNQEEIAKLLGQKNMYYSFDSNQYHFVALSFEMTGHHTKVLSDIRAELPREQIDWLVNDLLKTKYPVVVFIHYPLTDDDMNGNFWFENAPDEALLGNRKQIRKILEDSGKVKAVISAHQHWNRMFVYNYIPYFTVTSLVENFNNDGLPSDAHTIVDLNNNRIKVEVRGNDPAKYEFTYI
jgi:3',5'-cyclic AMP phosphodiesterase CpdA